jgi:hypothetical protein
MWRIVITVALVAAGCGEEGAPEARRTVREEHLPRVKEIVREDMDRHRQGIRDAAERLAPGFQVEDPAERERQMRTALRLVRTPPRGVPEFIASPMTFLAAVGSDGKVIARDWASERDVREGEAPPDPMRGADFGRHYPVVRRTLREGVSGYGLGEFPPEGGPESSISMLFVAPARRDGQVVGAVVAGIPLWRMAQRLSTQLRTEHASEIERAGVLWAYIYKDDRLFSLGTPPELEEMLPNGATREAGLRRSPGGFTGQFQAFTRWYGYGVMPLRRIGDDVGVLIISSPPVH